MKNNAWKILIIVALAVVVGVVLATKHRPADPPASETMETQPLPAASGEPLPPTGGSAPDPVVRAAESSRPESPAPPAVNPNHPGQPVSRMAPPASPPAAQVPPAPEKKLPRLLDLGAKKCIPCKMMAPLLEELAKEYKGKMDVVFIDVWENPGAGEKYGIQSIPTQILYDADGKEFFRHVGFYPKEDILAKFKEKGITFE